MDLLLTWWGQAHDPWFRSLALGVYEHVQALATGWIQIKNEYSFCNKTHKEQ